MIAPVEQICADLIRFDTSNPGGDERAAAEYVAGLLTELGLEPVVLEAQPRRSNVVARVAGTDPSLPALLVQGHLDTVPADPAAWSKDPRSGDIEGGYVWGRGAVDMKNAVAMTIAALGTGIRPVRDVVLAFLADEETGGRQGAGFLVNVHPELFEGCAAAIGEVGGFNVTDTVFAISVADKGLRWYEHRRSGIAGHGSMIARDNPIPKLARGVLAVTDREHEPAVTEPMRLLASRIAGREVTDDDEVVTMLSTKTGPFGPMLAAGARNTVNVTQLGAGYKENVIPGAAWARFDCRFVPGHESQLHDRMTRDLGDDLTLINRHPAVVTEHEGEWFDRLSAALCHAAPDCAVAPYVFSGSTDNKWFAQLGMRTYGFTPMLLPPGYDYPAMFHGVDERCPVDALRFGVEVLAELMSR